VTTTLPGPAPAKRLAAPKTDDVDAVAAYLQEIGGTSLLTAAQEVELAQAIEQGRAAAAISPDDTADDLERAGVARTGRAAAEHLASANLRLVVSVARRYGNRGLLLGDLIQEGNLGLLHAVETFDWRRGFRFSTYATWWIRQSIQRGVDNQGRTIRLPVGVGSLVARLIRTRGELHRDLQREATDAEVAAVLGVSAERVQELQRMAPAPISFDTPVGDDGDTILADLLRDEHAIDGADQALVTAERQEIEGMLGTLSLREQQVMAQRFGFGTEAVRTLAEIGLELGITRERVRQIEAKALRKLRRLGRSQPVDYRY
jgi:RNA polymerase primary sigma factor